MVTFISIISGSSYIFNDKRNSKVGTEATLFNLVWPFHRQEKKISLHKSLLRIKVVGIRLKWIKHYKKFSMNIGIFSKKNSELNAGFKFVGNYCNIVELVGRQGRQNKYITFSFLVCSVFSCWKLITFFVATHKHICSLVSSFLTLDLCVKLIGICCLLRGWGEVKMTYTQHSTQLLCSLPACMLLMILTWY